MLGLFYRSKDTGRNSSVLKFKLPVWGKSHECVFVSRVCVYFFGLGMRGGGTCRVTAKFCLFLAMFYPLYLASGYLKQQNRRRISWIRETLRRLCSD